MADAQRLADPSPQRAAAVVLALLALVYLPALNLPLFDVDEGAFAQASAEMLRSGDWGHTTLNGHDRFDKPILVYWLQAASLALFGQQAWAARLPSVLSALAMVWVAGLWAGRLFGDDTRWRAMLLVGGSLGFLVIGRAATADALLQLCLVTTGYCLWRFIDAGDRRWLRGAAVAAALGFLTKGPVALLVPGAAWLLWSAFSDRGRSLGQGLRDVWAWLLFAAVALPWYGYALARHGRAFVDGFFLTHNVQRFAGPMESHGGSIGYYILVLPLLALPWTGLLWPVLRRARALAAEPGPRLLLLWAGFVLVFFSLSGTKLPHYVLYGLVPLALLAAQQWRLGAGGWLWPGTLLLAATMVLAPLAALHWQSRLPAAWLQGLVAQAPPVDSLALAAALLAMLLGALAAVARRWPARSAPALGAAVIGVGLLVTAVAWPWWSRTLQGPLYEAARWARAHGGTIVQWQAHQPSFSFHRGVMSPRRDPAPGDWALIRRDRWEALGRPGRVLHDQGVWLVVDPAGPVAGAPRS